jgi:hypothetical protein
LMSVVISLFADLSTLAKEIPGRKHIYNNITLNAFMFSSLVTKYFTKLMNK